MGSSESNKCPNKDGPRKRKIITFYGTRANGEDGVQPRWITFSSFHNSSHHTQPLSIIVHYYSLQILCLFSLALTTFGRCEQCTIDPMVHLPGNEAAWVNSELKKWRSRLSEDEIAEFLNKPERTTDSASFNNSIDRLHILEILRESDNTSCTRNIFLFLGLLMISPNGPYLPLTDWN